MALGRSRLGPSLLSVAWVRTFISVFTLANAAAAAAAAPPPAAEHIPVPSQERKAPFVRKSFVMATELPAPSASGSLARDGQWHAPRECSSTLIVIDTRINSGMISFEEPPSMTPPALASVMDNHQQPLPWKGFSGEQNRLLFPRREDHGHGLGNLPNLTTDLQGPRGLRKSQAPDASQIHSRGAQIANGDPCPASSAIGSRILRNHFASADASIGPGGDQGRDDCPSGEDRRQPPKEIIESSKLQLADPKRVGIVSNFPRPTTGEVAVLFFIAWLLFGFAFPASFSRSTKWVVLGLLAGAGGLAIVLVIGYLIAHGP